MRLRVRNSKNVLAPVALLVFLCFTQTLSAGEVYLAKHWGTDDFRDTRRSRQGRWNLKSQGFKGRRYDPGYPYPRLHGSRFIRKLPFRAERVYFNGIAFEYYNGIFYRPHDYGYIRVAAPFGICVSHLPAGYHRVYLRKGPAYEHRGTFYVKYHGKYQVVSPFGPFVPARQGEKK